MKDNKQIYEPLFEKFDEVPPMPEGLSKENMLSKLKNTKQESRSSYGSFKTLYTIAAVFAVILLAAFGLDVIEERFNVSVDDKVQHQSAQQQVQSTTSATVNDEKAEESTAQDVSSPVLKKMKSDKELEEYFVALYRDSKLGRYHYYADSEVYFAPTAGIGDTVKNEASVSVNTITTDDYSETNVQTLGVDEGDVIKNDGRYFYIIGTDSSFNKKLRIFDSETMQYVYNDYLYDDKREIVYINDIYVNGNNLVAICSSKNNFTYSSYSYAYRASGDSAISSYVFDVSDKSNIKLVKSTSQDGSYISSRMIGSILYTVTEYAVFASTEQEVKEKYMPKVNGEAIGCDCILIENEKSQRYICITAYDTADAQGTVSKIAMLSDADTVYCSENNLYVFGIKYLPGDEYNGEKIADCSTVINAFSLDGTSVTHIAKGEIDGEMVNKYCADEFDGYLRVATNYYDIKKQTNSNALFILDKKLNVVGKIRDIAKTELIKSVRFMGKEGYIVTFKNTDPLFSIDLSDPKAPKIKGELKLPGYSTYLHPISESVLLGIGYDGDKDSADTGDIKVSMFDISDMKNPKEIDSIVFENSRTEGNYNAKAFVFDKARNLVCIPMNNGVLYKCKLIKVDGKKLSVYRDFLHEADEPDIDMGLFRTAYIGDNFYCISSAMVTRYSISSGEKTAEKKLYGDTAENKEPQTTEIEGKTTVSIPSITP